MIELLKDYYVFMLILMVISYLVPKDDYKSYIQFFIGVFVVVLFIKPVLEMMTIDNPSLVTEVFDNINSQIEHIDMETEGVDIFEYFFFEGEGE